MECLTSQIKTILKQYVSNLQQIDVDTDEEFYAAIDANKQLMLKEVMELRDLNPESLLCYYSSKITPTIAKQVLKRLQDNAKDNYLLEFIPSCEYEVHTIQHEKIITPCYLDMSDGYQDVQIGNCFGVKKEINHILLSLLLQLPIKKIKFTFVDFGGSLLVDFFLKEIHPSIYNSKLITDTHEFKQYLKKTHERVIDNIQKYGDVRKYNDTNKTFAEPYEFIILLDDADKGLHNYLQDFEKELNALKRNCAAGGVYVMNFHRQVGNTKKIDVKNALVSPTLIENIPNLLKCCVEYIKIEAEKEDETQVLTLDTKSLKAASYEPIMDSLSIPVGKKGVEPVAFCMDSVSHVHAFILGQSGSGKSVFLHNVISGAMLKYSPEELELYLLDFKLGGVEFNRYADAKHVHALLVDNSDQQVTLEILRELRERMTERGKQLRNAGYNNIKEYNEQNTNNKMKQILFVADECHEMFHVNDNSRAVGNEISEILVKIAKEGRNQGVHLVLATQTLANTDISSEIINNISDHYLLKCALADSEKMVTKSSDITGKLTTGNVYYHHVDNNYVFQAYYSDKQHVEEIMQIIGSKSANVKTNLAFYFNGASLFSFDQTVLDSNAKKFRRTPVAFVGKSIDINQEDVHIPLKEDYSENILLLGLNDEYQLTRVSINLLISLIAVSKQRNDDVEFKIIDCLTDDDKFADLLYDLEDADLVDIVPAKKRASFFKQLADDVQAGIAKETMLFILGQDRFRELKLDLQFENETELSELVGITAFGLDTSQQKKSAKSFSEALNVILDKGPEQGVHTIIQLEKAANYLFEDYISHKELFQKFKHLLLLKSDENAATQLRLRNDIHLENLCKEEERLRAYYYAEESDTYTLFTPYIPLQENELKQFIKTL